MSDRKLSPAMVRMLRDAARGNAFASIRGRSAHGGAAGTMSALVRRGLLASDYRITDAGIAELARRT